MVKSSDEARVGLSSADDRYQLTRLIGRGGMGEVWEARDQVLGRRVALKLSQSGHGSFEADRWLAAEAQTVVRLSHPSLVALLDRTLIVEEGEPDPSPALVFEYIDGRPMGLWVDRPRPWRWVRSILEQILDALAYAHGRGVVHRDLKPANVLLSGDPASPTVHLLDFGIATLYSPGRAGDSFGSSLAMTAGLMAPGTRAYMAPEQLEGDRGDIGPWSDIYSLGVVAAELLLGRLPFEGTDDQDVWAGRLKARFSPPVHALSELGVPLRRWLLRMLAPDPVQRFGWAADAARALPSPLEKDLTGAHLESSPSPEATDMLMEVAERAEDRDTDPDLESMAGDSMVTHGSGTLEIAPAAAGEVMLPPSWVVDQPDPGAWDVGLAKVPASPQAPIPAASYGLLSMRDAPLSGRDEEWGEAWRHLQQASVRRRPVLLLVEGPRGRGKTRFARELAAVAEEVGVVRSHHVRFRGDGSGAGALRRLLHGVLRIARLPEGDREERVQRVLAEAGYPTEADLVPRLIAMITPRQHRRGPSVEEPATAAELLQVLGRRRPLLLWLEDIDRAEDRALGRWLRELFSRTGDLPVAVVATRRRDPKDDESGPDPDWAILHADPGTLRIEMSPLPDESIGSLLRVTAGASEVLGMEIARWSRGDPRAARQTARHLHETGRLRWSPEGYLLKGDTPSTAGHLKLDAILASRARAAIEKSGDPSATAMLLDLLALVRERAVHRHLIEAAIRLGLDERQVEEALAPLVLSEIVDVRDEGPRLAHTTLAEYLSERMDLNRRAAMHRAWANVLEASGRGYGRAERLLEAAWNRAACGEDDQAARAELEAAHLLRQRWEIKAAWRAVDRAVRRTSGDRPLLREEELADLQVLAALLEHEVREPPGTPSELAMSLDMLQPIWVALSPCVERCRADLLHADALRRAGRPEDARESLQRGLEAARAIESWSWECAALVDLANDRRLTGSLSDAERLAGEAWEIAQRLDDDPLLHRVLLVRLPIALARGRAELAELWLGKLRGFLRTRASWQDLQVLWRFRGEVEWLSGNRAAARHAFETARGLGRDRGLPNASVLLSLATMSLEEGGLEEAGAALREAAAPTETGDPHSHEQRAARAILSVEQSFRSGDSAAGSAALQDAEILMSQFLIADPRGIESLERTEKVQGLDAQVASRVGRLASSIRSSLSSVPSGADR